MYGVGSFLQPHPVSDNACALLVIGNAMTGEGVPEPLLRASEADAVQGHQGDVACCVSS